METPIPIKEPESIEDNDDNLINFFSTNIEIKANNEIRTNIVVNPGVMQALPKELIEFIVNNVGNFMKKTITEFINQNAQENIEKKKID